MKSTLLSLLLIGLVGCGNNPHSKPETKPETMTEWIASMNAKHEKCANEYWAGGGSNGYDSWETKCVNGSVVYSDTTQETQKLESEDNERKAKLGLALVSRCLTVTEMQEVTQEGYEIYTRPMTPFYKEDLQNKFNAALQTQQILRQACQKVTQ